MSQIDDLIAKLCPEGVKFKTIGEIAECLSGATPASGVAAYWEDGTIPWMSSGEVNKGTVFHTEKRITQAGFDACSTKMVPPNAVVIALAGQGKTRGMVARIRISLCTNQSLCSIVCNETVNSDFLYYFLSTQYQQLRSVSAGDGGRGGLNLQMIRSYRIPVPPLEVQREIVKVLDTFTQLEAELEAELEARRRQYQCYRDSLLALPKAPRMQVGDLFDFKNGLNKGKEFFGKGSPIVNFVDVFKNRSLTKTMINGRVEVTPKEQNLYSAKKNDVFFTRTSETRDEIGMASVLLADIEDCVFSGFVLRARPKTELLLPEFCAYVFSSPDVRKEIVRNSSYTTRALTNGGVLSRLNIPIPPHDEQERIVSILDKFDALVNDLSTGLPAELKARRQQYEHYRDRLLTFKEAA